MLKKYLETNFFSSILIPFIVLGYFISYKYLISSILKVPNGVNYFFVNRTWKYLLLFATGNVTIHFVLLFITKVKELKLKNPSDKFSIGDTLLLLLPLTPVVQYIIINQDILSSIDSWYVIFFIILFSGFYIFAIPILFGSIVSPRTLMILGVAFAFTLTSMASLSIIYAWFELGSLKIQWIFFGIVFLVAWLVNKHDRKILRLIIAVIFVTNSASQLFTPRDRTIDSSLPLVESKFLSHIEDRIPEITPNIYLLVYDAYVSNETMLAYGIDNSTQEQFLESQGFELYPHTYSVAASSISTMSMVFNVSSELYNNKSGGVSGDGIIQNTLRGYDYETLGIFPHDYYFRNNPPTYDYSFPESRITSTVLLSAIFMGEFRFNIGFDDVPREHFIETKLNVFKSDSQNPVFVYTHSDLPGHSQNSGVCRVGEIDLYNDRLISANMEMRVDINTITENNPNAIVIVAGDHGPYLTKNCTLTKNSYDISEISRLDIQDRFGTFLAIKWPAGNFETFDDITILQDLFPAVFAYLYNDIRILESKFEPITIGYNEISGASVQNGIIIGGINDGDPLFITDP